MSIDEGFKISQNFTKNNTENFSKKNQKNSELDICILCIGGAGGNIGFSISDSSIGGEFKIIAINTDEQALIKTGLPKEDCILIYGNEETSSLRKGHGAGANPDIAKVAAENCLDQILKKVDSSKLVFLVAGEGKGTGTGATPVIAKALKAKGILTIAFVTTPFLYEGERQFFIAQEGIKQLEPCVDSLMVIPNENLLKCSTSKTTINDAMQIANNLLFSIFKSINNALHVPGFMNVDFTDFQSILQDSGRIVVAYSDCTAATENIDIDVETVVREAMDHPLLDSSYRIEEAQSILIHITGNSTLGIKSVESIVMLIQERIENKDCRIIIGTTVKEENSISSLELLIIATGLEQIETEYNFQDKKQSKKNSEKIKNILETETKKKWFKWF